MVLKLTKEEESMAFDVFAFNNRSYFGTRDCAAMVWRKLKPCEKKSYLPKKEDYVAWKKDQEKTGK